MINQKLKDVLVSIDFVGRFSTLVETYSNADSSLESPDLNKVQALIESFGYSCKYNKKHKFFKILNVEDKNSYLNFSVKYGMAEFILSIDVGGEPSGDTYSVLNYHIGSSEDFKNPFFSNYEELSEILKEGFSIYEDVLMGLNKVAA